MSEQTKRKLKIVIGAVVVLVLVLLVIVFRKPGIPKHERVMIEAKQKMDAFVEGVGKDTFEPAPVPIFSSPTTEEKRKLEQEKKVHERNQQLVEQGRNMPPVNFNLQAQ